MWRRALSLRSAVLLCCAMWPLEGAAQSEPKEEPDVPAPSKAAAPTAEPTQVIIKLADGRMFKGQVVEEKVGSHLLLRTADGQVVRVAARDIVAFVPVDESKPPEVETVPATPGPPAREAGGEEDGGSNRLPVMTSEMDGSDFESSHFTKRQKGALLVVLAHLIQAVGAGVIVHGIAANGSRGTPFFVGGGVLVLVGNGIEAWGWTWAGSPPPRTPLRLSITGLGARLAF